MDSPYRQTTELAVLFWKTVFLCTNPLHRKNLKTKHLKKIDNAPYFHLYPDGPGYLLTSLTGIARTDADLNIQWRRTYGSAVSGTQFFPIAARPKTSGGYLLAGYGRQVSQAKFAIAFTDADASGAPLLPRLYTPSGLPVATETTMQLCLPTADGGFLCGGQIQNSGTGGPEWYVLKLNGNGGVQWSRGFRSGGEERLCDIRQLPDGSYIATFNLPAQYAGAPSEVLYCQALGMDEETQTKSGLQVFPNPSTGLMEVQTPEEPWSGTGATFYLFDLTGKMLLWETLPPGSKPGLFSLDLSSFPPGCYLGRFTIGKKSFSAKLVKL